MLTLDESKILLWNETSLSLNLNLVNQIKENSFREFFFFFEKKKILVIPINNAKLDLFLMHRAINGASRTIIALCNLVVKIFLVHRYTTSFDAL